MYPAVDGFETVSVVVPASCCVEQGFEYCTVIRSQGCKMALLNTIMDRTGWISIVGMVAVIMTVCNTIILCTFMYVSTQTLLQHLQLQFPGRVSLSRVFKIFFVIKILNTMTKDD